MATEIIVPKMGQTVETCKLLEWFVKKGETVEKGEPVFSLETDKAAFDIEAPASGFLQEVFFEAGAEVPVNMIIGIIGTAAEDTSGYKPVLSAELASEDVQEQKKSPDEPHRAGILLNMSLPGKEEEMYQGEERKGVELDLMAAEQESCSASDSPREASERVFITPRAKKLAEEKGLDYTKIQGSGPEGRIKEHDVLAYLEAVPEDKLITEEVVKEEPLENGGVDEIEVQAPLAEILATSGGEPLEEAGAEIRIPVLGPRKIIAQKMLASLTQTAQLTLTMTANASDLVRVHRMLKTSGKTLNLPSITYSDLVHFAVARLLLKHRALNACFLGEEIVMPAEVHLAFAVDTPRGLLVPVIRNAHKKSLTVLATEAKNLAEQAQDGAINPDLLTGGTFTVSNLGQFGVEQFTPVLNPPQVAALGVGAIKKQPFETKYGYEFEPVLHLSLTIDHRGVDGAPGARFLQTLKTGLENFTVLLLQDVMRKND